MFPNDFLRFDMPKAQTATAVKYIYRRRRHHFLDFVDSLVSAVALFAPSPFNNLLYFHLYLIYFLLNINQFLYI